MQRAADAQAEALGRQRSEIQQQGGQQAFGVASTVEQQRLAYNEATARRQQDEAYQQQQQAMGLLQARAEGTAGPSAAQLQAGQMQQQNLVNQMGMAAQAQGGSMASQQRAGAAMGAASGMAGITQQAQLQAQEQQAAQQALAQQANVMGAQSQAGLQFGAGQNMAASQFVQSQGQQAGQFQQQQDFTELQAQRERNMQLAQMGLGAAQSGGQAMMSDEESKHIESRRADDEVMEALDGLAAVKYRYRESRYGPTGHDILGITTQDLSRSSAGAQLVRETPMGQAVDLAGAASLSLAGLGALAKKVRRLEGLAGARHG